MKGAPPTMTFIAALRGSVRTNSIAPYSRVEEYSEEYIDEPPVR